MRHRLGLASLAAFAACGATLVAVAPAQALTCPAFKNAVEHAKNGDVITLDQGFVCHDTYTLPPNKNALDFTMRGGGSGATLDGSGKSTRIMTGEPASGKQLHVTIRNLTFRNGTAPTGSNGGAIDLHGEDVSATIDHGRFFSNSAPEGGGAIHISSTGSSRTIAVTKSTFGDGTADGANRAGLGGAAVVSSFTAGPSAKVNGNKFHRNVALSNGGALQLAVNGPGATMTANDNTFTDNRSHGNDGGAMETGTNSLTLRRNTFVGNRIVSVSSGIGRGAGLVATGDPGIGATLVQSGNRFEGNRIVSNSQASFDAGGGGEWADAYVLTSRNDRFTGNSIPSGTTTGAAEGGGLGVEGCPGGVQVRLENAAIAGNTAGAGAHGAGLYVGGCASGPVNLSIFDSTISGNTTSGAGATSGLFGGGDDSLTMRNSIVAANPGGANLTGFAAGLTVTSSDACLSGGAIPAGAGNICKGPKLVDPKNGNVHEKSVSPTVDHGASATVPPTLKKDYEGDNRIIGPSVDMGADEFR